jgi:hypothetical protein
MAGLEAAAAQAQRPPELGRLEISVTPSSHVDAEMARRYADIGVDRLILRPPRHADAATFQAFVAQVGDSLVGRV